MSVNPIGPLSLAEWQEAIDAPYGKAVAILRKHDPLWGRAEGEKVKWRARYTRTVPETGYAIVEAATKEEAEDLARDIDDDKIDWDVDFDEPFDFDGVELVK